MGLTEKIAAAYNKIMRGNADPNTQMTVTVQNHLDRRIESKTKTVVLKYLENKDIVIGRSEFGKPQGEERIEDSHRMQVPSAKLSLNHVIIGLRDGKPHIWIDQTTMEETPVHADWDGDSRRKALIEKLNTKDWSPVPRVLLSTHPFCMPLEHDKIFKVGVEGHTITVKFTRLPGNRQR